MRLRDSYDVPQEIVDRKHSPAFRDFLWNWFGDTRAISRGDLDVSFLQELSGEELAIAKELIRRNLKVRHMHIIQAAAELRDIDAVPELQRLLAAESDVSWRLVISGALWNLVRDPVFVTCLERAKAAGGDMFAWAHLYQVLWLDDERAVDFLIDLLDQKDSFVRFQVLGLLNTLELGRRIDRREDMVYGAEDYRKRRTEQAFRRRITDSIREWIRKNKTGIVFGFAR